MRRTFRLKPSVLLVPFSLFSFYSYSAGFQLNESSASGLGRAFAGESAIGDNASIGSRNPAGMMLFSSPAVSAGITYIDPNIDLQGTSPQGNSLKHNDIAPSAWVPNLHLIYPVDEKWAVGFFTTSNFGLATDFPKDYPAGPLAGKTNLTTVNFNLSGAYRVNSNFSLGLGVNAVYADAEITRHVGENRFLQSKIIGLKPNSTIAKLTGDDWGYGWNAGILYEFDDNDRLGLSYRSKVDVKFNGCYSSDIPSVVNPLQAATHLPWGTNGNSIPAKLTLNLPEIWEFSGYHRLQPQWAIHYSASYITWHRFKELKATDNGHRLFYKDESFDNSYRLALGGTHYFDRNWTFGAGFAFDQTPIPKSHYSISIPDQCRLWYTSGATYAFTPQASVDVGLAYMHGQKVTIHEKSGPDLYTFKATGQAWLTGVNFNYQF